MVDNPREVVGAVLKSLGGTYNTSDFDAEIPGGREAVKERFVALQRQVTFSVLSVLLLSSNLRSVLISMHG